MGWTSKVGMSRSAAAAFVAAAVIAAMLALAAPLAAAATNSGGGTLTCEDTADGNLCVENYVALGDSFAAGSGVQPYKDAACQRSASAYPELFADAQVPLFKSSAGFFACSGATVDDIERGFKRQPHPQLKEVNSTSALISVSAGGNDSEIFHLLHLCVLFGFAYHLCHAGFGALAHPGIAAAEHNVGVLLRDLHDRAPQAIIYVVGYPNPFPAHGTCSRLHVQNTRGIVKVNADDASYLNHYINDIDSAVHHAVDEASSSVPVGWVAPFTGHDVCSSDPWFARLSRSPTALHPNLAGNQSLAKSLGLAIGLVAFGTTF